MAVEAIQTLTKRQTTQRYYGCLKAFGHKEFCTCLRDKSPWILSFNDYIKIVTSTKEELNYEQLKEDDKKLVELTLKVREQCVAKVKPK